MNDQNNSSPRSFREFGRDSTRTNHFLLGMRLRWIQFAQKNVLVGFPHYEVSQVACCNADREHLPISMPPHPSAYSILPCQSCGILSKTNHLTNNDFQANRDFLKWFHHGFFRQLEDTISAIISNDHWIQVTLASSQVSLHHRCPLQPKLLNPQSFGSQTFRLKTLELPKVYQKRICMVSSSSWHL